MKPIINKFVVNGLFASYNVSMIFDSNAKIIVGENGIGKTTILNIFYHTISKDTLEFIKLKEYDFSSIEIYFNSGVEVSFTKKELINYNGPKLPLELTRLKRYVSEEEMKKIVCMINNGEDMSSSEYLPLFNELKIEPEQIGKYSKILGTSYYEYFKIQDIRNKILNETNFEIIYLPTYRRIEEERANLDVEITYSNRRNNEINNRFKFGLEDVQDKINKITSDIKKAYRIGFSKMSAEILKDMASERKIANIEFNSIDKFNIIIDRIDDEILNLDEKNRIKQYITKNINKTSSNNKEYNYFLNKLLNIYKEQEKEESKLIDFKNKCNDYLYNKEFIYNEGSLELNVVDKISKREVKLNKLSSGEKQIISLFANIYLVDRKKKFIVLFDEPELSLSLEWQRKLLPDIYETNKCVLLLAVTHSPFIFDNELDKFAVSLDRYVGVYNG